MKNFDITGVPISHFPQFIRALAMVKKAAALANNELGYLTSPKMKAIVQACDEIIVDEALLDQFPVDLIQGGAGTSTNMAANEVIANRGLEIMGHQKGEYQYLHPNNDVNQSQSTNDVYPTAARLAMCFSDDPLIDSVRYLMEALNEKAVEFKDVLKLGRTQLQDAVPMTLGQEFQGWSENLGKDLVRMDDLAKLFATVNMGGTAIGTGINTDPKYTETVVRKLSEVTGLVISAAPNMIDASSDMGDFLIFSGLLRRLAVKLSKIANDLRLLSSGPRGGLNDINLPAVQPGSSIMPGKVNPVIPEAVNQTSFQVIGNDLAITLAAEAGQLQLNYAEPLIVYNLLSNLRMMTNACYMLTDRCIKQITANKEDCEKMVYNSIGIVTAFNPHIGYEKSSAAAKKALLTGGNVVDIIREEGYLTEDKISEIMKVENLTGPTSLMKRSVTSVAELNRSLTHMRVSSVDASFFNNVVIQDDGGPLLLPPMTPGHRRRHTSTSQRHFIPSAVSSTGMGDSIPSSLQLK
mmetsp:Transcript_8982/g.22664  ORF Transcript_8982/g.22664 Transcript_8982/m.22664 type:complete len:521 (-) Transcript_8982:119-1681(-)